MLGAHTERACPPVLGRGRVRITNKGLTLHGRLWTTYRLYGEQWQSVGITGGHVQAPVPGEVKEIEFPFPYDAARYPRLEECKILPL